MGPKKGRQIARKIEVPTDTPTEFELGYTPAETQSRRQDREQRERAEKQQRKEREAWRRKLQSQTQQAMVEKRPRTERSESEMATEGG